MQPPDVGALATECLPGRGVVELQPIGAGLCSDTYRARRDRRSFVVRLTRAPTAAGSAGQEFEALLVEQAAACGLAPPLVHSDPRRGLLVLEWVPGATWVAAAAAEPARIEAAASLIRRVHALRCPTPVRACSPRGWVDLYRGALGPAATLPAGLNMHADLALQQLTALTPATAVVCHSDLHTLNVLELPGGHPLRSVLLDWEYAHVSEPGWDLAGWSANNDFTATQSRALLRAYAGGGPGRVAWQRFALLRWLFDYVCVLWIHLYRLSRPTHPPALGDRAVLLETRLNAAVCGKLATSDPFFIGDCEWRG